MQRCPTIPSNGATTSKHSIHKVQRSEAAGSIGVSDLASVGGEKHAHRNLLRKLLKKSKWPKVYHASVRVWNRRTNKECHASIPMLLPHEFVHVFRQHAVSKANLLDRGGMDTTTEEHLRSASAQLGITGDVLGLAFWIDGVACKWDRSESQDMLMMSLPGVRGRWRDLRIPLCTLPHCWVTKHNTFDDILSVMTWSLRQAARGAFPACRRDGTPWAAEDVYRKRLRGRIGCSALLCQITGDWKMYKDIFRFPQHNEKKGCCFKCEVTPDGIRNTGPSAPWRHQRLDHWGLLLRLRQHGLQVSPLFEAPGIRAGIFRVDWLHVADLGTAADWLGQLFTVLQSKCSGHNVRERCDALDPHS